MNVLVKCKYCYVEIERYRNDKECSVVGGGRMQYELVDGDTEPTQYKIVEKLCSKCTYRLVRFGSTKKGNENE